MPEWIPVDPHQLDQVRERNVKGMHVHVRVSPFDVPEAVRGFYDPRLKRFIVEFRYMGEEPWSRQQENQNVSVRIGKHSGRLYGIELNVEPTEAASLRLSITTAMNSFDFIEKRHQRKDNYLLARQALAATKDRVYESVVASM